MNTGENQFSLTRVASKPAAPQKNQIPISCGQSHRGETHAGWPPSAKNAEKGFPPAHARLNSPEMNIDAKQFSGSARGVKSKCLSNGGNCA
jgi:hypothetical protein